MGREVFRGVRALITLRRRRQCFRGAGDRRLVRVIMDQVGAAGTRGGVDVGAEVSQVRGITLYAANVCGEGRQPTIRTGSAPRLRATNAGRAATYNAVALISRKENPGS